MIVREKGRERGRKREKDGDREIERKIETVRGRLPSEQREKTIGRQGVGGSRCVCHSDAKRATRVALEGPKSL